MRSEKVCPKCDAAIADPAETECRSCGVVLAKAVPREIAHRRRQTASVRRHARGESTVQRADSISAKRSLAIGAAVALAVYIFPLSRFVFSYLTVLFHELGHTFAGFLFGYPSIPSFDFLYGGGVTMYFGRSTLFLIVVAVCWCGLAVYLRHWPRLMGAALVLGAAWLAAAVTSWHDLLLNMFGHGAELLFAGWCFYKTLSGNVRSRTERWLYAACGFFVVLLAWVFALRLIESEVARREYEQAKGGGHWMDMSRISRFLEMDLAAVALVYWLAATLLPVAVYLLWLNRRSIGSWFTASGR